MSSSSSEGLFVYKAKAAAVFHDSPRQGAHCAVRRSRAVLAVTSAAVRAAGEAAESRPARRPEQPQSKRARTRAIVLDLDDEEEDEEPIAVVDVAAPVAEPAPADADESAWVRALAALLPRRRTALSPLCRLSRCPVVAAACQCAHRGRAV